jgi:hypothetical protein
MWTYTMTGINIPAKKTQASNATQTPNSSVSSSPRYTYNAALDTFASNNADSAAQGKKVVDSFMGMLEALLSSPKRR